MLCILKGKKIPNLTVSFSTLSQKKRDVVEKAEQFPVVREEEARTVTEVGKQ